MAEWPVNEQSREAAIVDAYLAGKKITDIEETFGVGRSTIFHYLRRADKVPNRSRRQIDNDSKDAALAGLYDLIQHQDRRIEEADELVAGLRGDLARAQKSIARLNASLASAERKIARLSKALASTNGVLGKDVRAG